MKPCHLATAILFSGVVAVSAYDIETRDGRVFKDIRLREKTALGIRITHEKGVAWLDYSELKVPHVWTFGFNEAEYNAAKKGASGAVVPTTVTPSRPTRLYQSIAATPPVDRPPIGTTTALSQPARPAGVSSAFSGLATRSTSARYTSASGGTNTPEGSNSPSVSGASRGQCSATTKKGYRCSRMASAGSSYCWQHP